MSQSPGCWGDTRVCSIPDATCPPDGWCNPPCWDAPAAECSWCPGHRRDIALHQTSGDPAYEGSNPWGELLCNSVITYVGLSSLKYDLDGEHLGWKYELLRTVPVSAILWRLGVTMSGLCQETSFQPRSSANITTRRETLYLGSMWISDLSLIFGGLAALTETLSVRINMKHFIVQCL